MIQDKQNIIKIFTKYFFVFSLFTIFSYFLNLYINQENFFFYYCDEIVNYKLNTKNSSFNINYIFSCDEPKYFYILDNPSLLLSSENYYQQRPLYVLAAIFLKYLFSSIFLIFDITFALINQLSFLILQIIILTFQAIVLKKILSNVDNIPATNNLMISLIIFLNPMNKWSLFQPGHQNMTTLIFFIGVYILQKKTHVGTYTPFLIGMLFLFHRSAALVIVSILLKNILSFQSYKKYFVDLLKVITGFSIPYLFFRACVYLTGNVLNDNQVTEYNQFTWIIDFVSGKETMYSGIMTGWYCQKIPQFAICYLIDNSKTILYLSAIFVLLIALKANQNRDLVSFDQYLPLILNFFLFYFFWMLIGWYPPIRFSFYSIGNFVIVLFALLLFGIKNKNIKNISIIIYSYYFLFINHWNAPEILNFSFGNIMVMGLLFIYLFFKSRDFKIFSK